MNDRELRTFGCELRMGDAGEGESVGKIAGLGAVFNSRSENLGGFREVIKPGAFDDCIGDDVRCLFNHDSNILLGRTASGTLSLTVDEEGLRYEVLPPDTQLVRDMVLAPIARNDINQSSFAFRVAQDGDEWAHDDEGILVRTIHRCSRLFDVSPVTYPAYQAASVALRSAERWQRAVDEGVLKRALIDKQARQRVLDMCA